MMFWVGFLVGGGDSLIYNRFGDRYAQLSEEFKKLEKEAEGLNERKDAGESEEKLSQEFLDLEKKVLGSAFEYMDSFNIAKYNPKTGRKISLTSGLPCLMTIVSDGGKIAYLCPDKKAWEEYKKGIYESKEMISTVEFDLELGKFQIHVRKAEGEEYAILDLPPNVTPLAWIGEDELVINAGAGVDEEFRLAVCNLRTRENFPIERGSE